MGLLTFWLIAKKLLSGMLIVRKLIFRRLRGEECAGREDFAAP